MGQTRKQPCPGYVTFTVNGETVRLEPIQDSPDDRELFFIFRDATGGETTYPPGRFLVADSPVEGKVVLDFNKAYNPPCAFTPFATCPLPPPQNRLKVKIEAGEKKPAGARQETRATPHPIPLHEGDRRGDGNVDAPERRSPGVGVSRSARLAAVHDGCLAVRARR